MLSRFKERFSGLERSHGVYTLGDPSPDDSGKRTGKAATLARAATDEEWAAHLDGQRGLGVCPVRDDGTCSFGAIDVDQYDLDLPEVERKIEAVELPLIVCRTKSGGVHLYLFCLKPISAKLVRAKLADWAVTLGFPKCEIFPKQDRILQLDNAGSWINLPYFGGTRTTRYAVIGGRGATLLEFLNKADQVAVGTKELRSLRPKVEGTLEGAPPCLENIIRVGVSEGTRNEVAFALGVFCKKKFEGEWERVLHHYNLQHFDPPMTMQELAGVAKSLNRKDYAYSCRHTVLSTVCDRNVCLQRKFGIGGASEDPGVQITGLTKILTDPPTWTINVEGGLVSLGSTDDLMIQQKFNKLCINCLSVLPLVIKAKAWEQIIRDLLAQVTEIKAPQDAGIPGQFLSAVEYFLTERPKARTREELLLGKALTEDSVTYFRSADLMKFLEINKIRGVTAREAWTMLANAGAVAKRLRVKTKIVRCWGMPTPPVKDDIEVDLPEGENIEF